MEIFHLKVIFPGLPVVVDLWLELWYQEHLMLDVDCLIATKIITKQAFIIENQNSGPEGPGPPIWLLNFFWNILDFLFYNSLQDLHLHIVHGYSSAS